MADCACGENWIVQSCNLKSGQIRTVLHPLSFDWQRVLNGFGAGSLTLATRDLKIADIWPHLVSIYILRVAGGGATVEDPVVEYAGFIEQVSADDAGTTKVGLLPIEGYLNKRNIRTDFDFSAGGAGTGQTVIAQTLTTLAASGNNGIPLVSTASAGSIPRDLTYNSWDRKNIGEAINDLATMENGLDWNITHNRLLDGWETVIHYVENVGTNRGVVLRSDREASGYGLDIDATNHATAIDGIGEGEEEDQMVATATDPLNLYPAFDAAPAWKDTWDQTILQAQTDGYLKQNQEPVASPNVTVLGLSPDPELIQLGDVLEAHVDYGAVTYHGDAQVMGLSWSVAVDQPETRTFDLLPLTRASESVYNQSVDGWECGC